MAVTPNSIVTPQTPIAGKAKLTAANTNYDAPTNAVQVLAGQPNGARLTRVQAIAAATTVASDCPASEDPSGAAASGSAPGAIDPANVVAAVAQSVQTHADVPASKAAGVIASILAGLYQAEPAIFGVTRASARTQAEVSLGLGLAEILVGAFLRRAS
jgi:hypothetical protein